LTIDIKQRLKGLKYIDIKARSKHQELISLRSGILKGQSFDNMPKARDNKNKTEELNVLIIDKSEQLYEEIKGIYRERDELVRLIESLEDPVENIVMRLFFIDGLTWSEVENKLGCSRGTIYNIRESAFENMTKNSETAKQN
jgi:sigma-70, region 4 family